MATRTALSYGFNLDALRLILRSGMTSAFSFGGFLAVYNGGICSLEKFRGSRDIVNPFVVGACIGVVGAVPGYLTPQPQAPWAFRNPRALVGAGLSSALLCSFFWGLSAGGTSRDAPAAAVQDSPPAPGFQQAPAVPQIPAVVPSAPAALPAGYDLPGARLPGLDGGRQTEDSLVFSEAASGAAPLAETATASSEQLKDPWASK